VWLTTSGHVIRVVPQTRAYKTILKQLDQSRAGHTEQGSRLLAVVSR
jgi:hypothetical protein